MQRRERLYLHTWIPLLQLQRRLIYQALLFEEKRWIIG
jgi:hypothetical protein